MSSSMGSPSPAGPSLRRSNRSASAIPASPSFASDMSAADLSTFDFESSDDEAGVFFGAHRPIERKIVAALSRSITSSPGAQRGDLHSSPSGPRRSSLANRVKKRDSREFLRRKTLLLPCSPDKTAAAATPTTAATAASGEKVWEGGFFEKAAEGDQAPVPPPQELDSPASGPSDARPDAFSVETASLHMLTDVPPSPDHDDYLSRPDSDDETDKENTMVPEPYMGSDEDDEYRPSVDAPTVTLGFGDAQDANDISTQLDLGGLSLLDLDDPEIGPLESPTRDPSFEVDLGESDSASGSDSVDSSTISSKFVLSDPFVYTAALGDAQSTDIPDSPPPAVSETASPVPCTPVKEASGDDDDTSFASDMTSPVGRGPVILPVFSIRSPVAHTTPVRGLEPSAFFDDLPLPQFGTDEAFSLPSLESPNSRGTTTPRYPALLPLATPASARIGSLTPARSVGKLKPIDLGDRPVKVLKSVHAGGALHSRSENDRRVEKAKERANRINGQLDAIYASKLAPTARPTAATMSTKIPERVSESVQKPRVRVGDSSSAPSRSTALSPKKIMRPSAPASVLKSALKPTSTLPTPRPASAQPNKRLAPTTVKAKPNGLPRPVARRPMAPPSVVAGPSFAQPTKSTSLHAGRPVVATPTTTGVKRPFSATQPVSAHPAAAAAAGRLGLPSRMTHSSAPSASPFAFGGASTLSVGGPLSHPPVRSPSRTLGSSLGKPSRGTGTTPTPQRTLKLGTPSRPMATPLKSGPMRPMAYSSYTAQPKVTLVPETTEPGPAPVDGGDSASGSAPTERSGDSPSSSSSNSGGDAGNGGDRTPPAGNGSDGGSAGNNNNAGHTPPERPPPSSSPPDESPPADDVANEAEKMDVDEAKPAAEPAAKEPSPSTPPPGDDVSSPVPTEIDVDPPEDSTPPAPPSSAEEPPQPAAESSSLRRTSKRSVRPPTKLVPTPAAPRAKAQPVESIVPGMSEKELKTATHRNTMRNEVYYCAIDRIIVRKTGARPPSPEPKIRMTADREEEDRKRQRDQRARRRQRGSGGDEPMSEDEEAVPLIEQVEQHRAPGDEADYQTPARPLKRARIESSDDEADDERPSVPERYVRWNRALTVIRGGLGEHRPVPAAASASPSATPQPSGSASASGSGSSSTSTSAAEQQLRSCLRPSSMVPLDKHGNVLERPIERLKRAKVPVTAVFYDGEEPLPVPAYNPNYNPRSKSKK